MEYPHVARDEAQFVALPELDQAGMAENWPACQEAVLNCFPDMCSEHLMKLASSFKWDFQQIITHVLDQQENGLRYPTQPNPAKRKRPLREEKTPEAQDIFEKDNDRLTNRDNEFVKVYTRTSKTLLATAFPGVYAADIEHRLKQNNGMLYRTYLAIERSLSGEGPRLRTKKVVKHPTDYFSFDYSVVEAERMAASEYRAAQKVSQARSDQELAKKLEEEAEINNMKRAQAEGDIADCECCYDEFALNRMVHCDGEVLHWFCRGCVKQMAETQVGLSKYQLYCMSTDGCKAEFSQAQRREFLDEKLTIALERLEQETVLRMAGIENLAKCPFCPYAAEYPPVEENKEFACENPDCLLVSCRLCDQETHIPKTCEEVVRETGHSARHRIEEAMSEALIRKCNKCGTPFIKENGCNKMACTAPSCGNVQCYVCSKSCEYAHFDDASRGGKKGNCPLFDSVEQRHEQEVKVAEEKAREIIARENPGVDAKMFDINFSEGVKADDERRKQANPGRPPQVFRGPVHLAHRDPPDMAVRNRHVNRRGPHNYRGPHNQQPINIPQANLPMLNLLQGDMLFRPIIPPQPAHPPQPMDPPRPINPPPQTPHPQPARIALVGGPENAHEQLLSRIAEMEERGARARKELERAGVEILRNPFQLPQHNGPIFPPTRAPDPGQPQMPWQGLWGGDHNPPGAARQAYANQAPRFAIGQGPAGPALAVRPLPGMNVQARPPIPAPRPAAAIDLTGEGSVPGFPVASVQHYPGNLGRAA